MSWQSFVHAARTRTELLTSRPRAVALAKSATRYAEHGWDVTPGAPLRGDLFDCGRISCRITTCHPAFDDWETNSASHDPNRIAAWWRDQPYAVLLMTGRTFDVLEVPATLGRAAVNGMRLADVGAPIAIAPGDRWMFLVHPGYELDERLRNRPDIVLHSRGSWIPAPPTRQPDGRSRWQVDPRTIEFRLGNPRRIQGLVVRHLPEPRIQATSATYPAGRTTPVRTVRPTSQHATVTAPNAGPTTAQRAVGASRSATANSASAPAIDREGVRAPQAPGNGTGTGHGPGPGTVAGPAAGPNGGRHFGAAGGHQARHRHQVG